MKKWVNYILLIIFIVGAMFRFLYLDRIPSGLQQDETSIGYNAYSILKTGKDEFGIRLPLFFKAFGEYKLPVLIYLTIPSIYFFGLTELGVRFPSALFGSITIIVFFLLLRKLFPKDKDIPPVLISTFLLAVNPWHIFFSRAAFEVVPALFFLICGLYYFIKSIEQKKLRGLVIPLIFFSLSAYTYNICRILTPIIYIGILWFYRKKIRLLINFKDILIQIFLIVIITIPYIISASTATSGLTGTFIFTSIESRLPSSEFRSYIWLNSPWIARVFTPIPLLLLLEYLTNILLYLSGSFFFVNGPVHSIHTTGISGLFYPIEAITIIGGIIALKQAKKQFYLLMFLAVANLLIASATREAPYATRSFFLIPSLISFSGFGIWHLYRSIRKIQNAFIKKLIILACLFTIYLSALPIWLAYVFRFPVAYAKSWRLVEKEVVQYISKNINKYDRIIIDPISGIKYTTLLFFLKYPPDEFQKTSIRLPDTNEGFSNVKSFGKVIFQVNWDDDPTGKNNLIITSANNVPKNIPSCITWYYPRRPVVVNADENMLTSFIDEEAFKTVDSSIISLTPDGLFTLDENSKDKCQLK